jgi:hypothetical protein
MLVVLSPKRARIQRMLCKAGRRQFGSAWHLSCSEGPSGEILRKDKVLTCRK